MKKLLAYILLLALLCSLTACGMTTSEQKVAVFYYSFEDAFLSNVRISLNDELAGQRIEHENFDAGNRQETQNAQIRAAVAEDFDVLIVNTVASNDPQAAREILRLADGIPVVFFNRSIEAPGAGPEVLREYSNAMFVGMPSGDAGHMQGELIGNYVTLNFDILDQNGDGEISYAMFKGSETSNECALRTLYSVEDANAILSAAGKAPLRYFDPDSANLYQVDPENKWSNAAALTFMTEDLATGMPIELVVCNNDDMAVGAIAALQVAGYNKQNSAMMIPVFGIDGSDVAQQLIAEGVMTGTVRQSPEDLAYALSEVTRRLLNGNPSVEAISATAGLNEDFSVSQENEQKLMLSYTMLGE